MNEKFLRAAIRLSIEKVELGEGGPVLSPFELEFTVKFGNLKINGQAADVGAVQAVLSEGRA